MHGWLAMVTLNDVRDDNANNIPLFWYATPTRRRARRCIPPYATEAMRRRMRFQQHEPTHAALRAPFNRFTRARWVPGN